MAGQTEFEAMRRAITPTARGLGHPSPNPVVGAVVPDEGISSLEWALRLDVRDVTDPPLPTRQAAALTAMATATQEA